MSEIKDGGPAFPLGRIHDAGGCIERPEEPGMSLRDYFAAKAMQGIIACTSDGEGYPPTDCTAERAYGYADEMLKTREAK